MLAMLLLPLAGSAAAVTTVVTVKGAHGQTFTVTQAKKLSAKVETITVSGRHFDETVIYVALCVLHGKGTVPTPCGGGIDKTGTSGASQWVSSNPPPYGVGLAIPFSVRGLQTETQGRSHHRKIRLPQGQVRNPRQGRPPQ